MAGHKVYRCIMGAVKSGRLNEPFRSSDFRKACPGFAKATYGTFPGKHRVGNPGGNSELFEKVSHGKLRLLRPFKYGIDC